MKLIRIDCDVSSRIKREMRHGGSANAAVRRLLGIDPPHLANCRAYNEDGAICRKPAVGIDYDKGCTVCAEHLDAYLCRHEQEATP